MTSQRCPAFAAVALVGLGCSSPSLEYTGTAPTRIDVNGRVFEVFVKGDRSQAIRVNREFGARQEDVLADARIAIERTSVCAVDEDDIRGDVTLVNASNTLLCNLLDPSSCCDEVLSAPPPAPPVAGLRGRGVQLHRAERDLLQPEERRTWFERWAAETPAPLFVFAVKGEPVPHPQPQAAPRRGRSGQLLRQRRARPRPQDGAVPVAAARVAYKFDAGARSTRF